MEVTRVDHVSFTVGELERSAAFYSRFGFESYKRYVSAGADVDEGHLLPSLKAQCVVANTNVNVNPQNVNPNPASPAG